MKSKNIIKKILILPNHQSHLSLALLCLAFISTPTFAEKTKISLKDGLKIKRDDTEFQFKARIMWDYDSFEGAHNEGKSSNDSELRHTRLTFQSEHNNEWEAKLQIDIDPADKVADSFTTSVADVYIQYIGWKDLDITIGKAKEPFGLETMTSSKDTTTIERSMASSAFSPGRNVGIGLSGEINQMTWALGLYEANEENEDQNNYAVTTRFTYTPWHNEHNNLLHLGLAGSIRDFDGEEYKIKERAEVHTADKIVTSAKILADQANLLGLEAAWVKGPFSLQAEYMTAAIKAEAEENANYTGYYLQASYFLTGESRLYEGGSFSEIKPHAKSGAWELAARYSVLDAEDNGSGVEATNVTFGINYYMNEYVRLMANYLNTELTGEDLDQDSGNALSLRLQYSF